MNPKEKRELERQQLSNQRRSEVLQAAKRVFHSKGIESATMTDIANEAEMGVASLYRYFNTKPELVIEAGIDYCRDVIADQPRRSADAALSGLNQVRALLNDLLRICDERQDFLIFLQQFDFYFANKANCHPRLVEFEPEIFPLVAPWFDAMECGLRDGSIISGIQSVDAVALILRSFISLQQRNLTRDHILSIDERFDRDAQLSMLFDMVIHYLATPESPVTEGTGSAND